MLEGQLEPNFKRAVFVTENAYLDGQLNYQQFNDKIGLLTHLGNRVITAGELEYDGKDRQEVLKNYASFRIMKDSIAFILSEDKDSLYGFQTEPYLYDFEDF